MVPRSLRWEVAPQKGELELLEWFQYFNQAGVTFLDFLVQRKKSKLVRLDMEIKLIKDKMSTYTNSEEYKERSTVLKKLLEKEEIEQKNKKKKKYVRDMGDYKAGAVFVWQSKISTQGDDISDPPTTSISQSEQGSQPSTSQPQNTSRSNGANKKVSL